MEKLGTKVKKVVIITRHGHRAPISFSKDETYWKLPAASLTAKGAAAMFAKGKFIRDQLKEFIEGKTFSQTNTTVYASNLHRTITTAYYFLRGLFNEETKCDAVTSEREALDYLSNYQFIRKPIKNDIVLRFFNRGISATFQENLKIHSKKKSSENIEGAAVTKLLNSLPAEQKAIYEDRDYLKLFYLFDYLTMHIAHELPIPYGVPIDVHNNLKFLQGVLDDMLFGSLTNVKLGNYAISREIAEILTNETNIFTLFSAHDINVSTFLRQFDYRQCVIPFGGQCMLLSYDDGHIEIFFYGDSVEKIASFASYEKLIEHMKSKTYQNDDDFLKELKCEVSDNILKTYKETAAGEVEDEVMV